MGKINVLPQDIANLIAAGEVVDRPASVLKELLENAVDAGATAVSVELRGGGVSMIRVTDNGSGIAREDLPVAIERHATSKVRAAEDLNEIFTLGFRGEALAAIAGVSLLTIISRRAEDSTGTLMDVEYGKIADLSEAGCAVGTTVIVERLFSNVPARQKFLKRDATEAMAALALAERVALSHPEIAFSMTVDGDERFSTPGDGTLKGALYAIEGREITEKLLSVSSSEKGLSLSGFIGRSDCVQGNRNRQNVFINGRYVRSKTVMAAVEQAFRSYIAPGKFPIFYLFLDMPHGEVDVNVHPAKLEVRFSDERPIFEVVYRGVREALAGAAYRGELETMKPSAKADPIPASPPTGAEAPSSFAASVPSAASSSPAPTQKKTVPPSPQPSPIRPPQEPALPMQPVSVGATFATKRALEKEPRPGDNRTLPIYPAVKKNEATSAPISFQTTTKLNEETGDAPSVETASAPPLAASVSPASASVAPSSAPSAPLPTWRIVGEAFATYVMVESEETLLFIDKHAAHERILFEDLLAEQKKYGKAVAQDLLIPLSLSLTPEETATLEESRKELEAVGFFLTKLSPYALTAIPSALTPDAAKEAFLSMLASIGETGSSGALSEAARQERALYQIACKAAIKGGRHYDKAHIRWLVERVMKNPDVTVCPHGRPIALTFTKKHLDREFNRIQH